MKYGLSNLDNLFGELFRDVFDSPQITTGAWNPRLDVTENEDSFLIEVELPGVDSKDIKLQVENGILYVSGTRTSEREIKDDVARSIVRERRTGHFSRSIRLGTVDADNISAKLDNGILNVTVPKKDPPKKIDILVE